MAKLDELLKAFRSREGIKGTTVAKMMSRKEAGNYTTIGSRVSNPFSHPKYNVSSIGRDKHYFLLNRPRKQTPKFPPAAAFLQISTYPTNSNSKWIPKNVGHRVFC